MAPPRHKDENELNINDEIRATQVRLVGDNIPEPGVYPIAQAMKMADEMELDLVEISGVEEFVAKFNAAAGYGAESL